MPQIDPVILQLRADVQEYQNRLKATTVLVTQQLDRQERAIHSLEREVTASTNRIGAAFQSISRSAAGFVAGFGLGAIVSELADLADTSKQLDAQLRLATATFGTFGQAQTDVRRIADETRGSLEATASLYGNFVRATEQIGGTQAQAARATETFAKALKIGGADAAEAASATLQFGQALASGVLRGDEFNSIAEASPRILKLVADAMGVTQGAVRGLAQEGKLTSDVLFRALTDRKFTGGIDAEFKQIPATFGDAMQAVENAALTTFGEFDKGGRFSDAIVAFLGTGTDTFEGLTSKAQEFGTDTRAVFDGLGNVFDPILVNGNSVFDALGIRIFSVRDQIASLLDSIDRVSNFDTNIENAVKRGFNRAIDRAGGGQHFEESPTSNLGGRFRAGARLSAAQSRREASARRLEGQGYIVPRNADGSINEAGIVKRPTALRRTATATQSDSEKSNAKALAKHQETLAGLERLKVGASQEDLATINKKIAREKKIVGNLEKGVSLSAATAAAGGAGGSGKTKAEREAAKATKEYNDFIADLKKGIRESVTDIGSDAIISDADRKAKSSRAAQAVFGREGEDYADPFADVDNYDKQRDARVDAAEEAEQRAQYTRENNVRSLADLYGDLFTRGTDDVWRNFKEQGLRTIALVLAQATIASFGKGGGGFGSLLSNIGAAASSAFSGTPGRASGGYVGPGQTVRVNEGRSSGVELLRMGAQGGTVIPLGQTATQSRGGGTTTVHQHFNLDARYGVTTPELLDYVQQTARTEGTRAGGAAFAASQRSAPGTLAQYDKLEG